jgi:hypothetical protein
VDLESDENVPHEKTPPWCQAWSILDEEIAHDRDGHVEGVDMWNTGHLSHALASDLFPRRVLLRSSTAKGVAVFLACALGLPASKAQTKLMDWNVDDWCFGQASVSRIENSSTTLTCGACEGFESQACVVSSDCPNGVPCVGFAYAEVVWWDDRTDAAVNDLATVALAQDDTNLYLLVALWNHLDAASLPIIQLAIDFEPGGSNELWDPGSESPHTPPDQIKAPGTCSIFTDRGCTKDEDCHFCMDTFEPPACCEDGTCPPEEICRVQTCGSGCDPGDTCDTSQTCQDLGTTPVNDIGLFSAPVQQADLVFIYDLSVWLGSGGAQPSVELREWDGSTWANVPAHCDITQAPCAADEDCPPVGAFPQQCVSRFSPGGFACGDCTDLTAILEVAVPWSAFGCTGCPLACSCPDFGPAQAFTYTAVVSRGEFVGDFVPRGEMEDVMSESSAGTTTETTNDCPGTGIGTTLCEIDDGSSDAFVAGGGCQPGTTGAGDVPDGHTIPGSPLLVESLPGGNFRISWSRSCNACDTDYALYFRELEDGPDDDWQPWLCSTGGSTMAVFHPDTVPLRAGFVAVPLNTGDVAPVEGTLGFRSDGTRRPASPSPCAAPEISPCAGVPAMP